MIKFSTLHIQFYNLWLFLMFLMVKKISLFTSHNYFNCFSRNFINLSVKKSAFCNHSICLYPHVFFSPSGIIPLFSIDTDRSGIIFFEFTSNCFPKPYIFLYILGELKEKEFGSGKEYDIPLLGHIKLPLKYLRLCVSLSTNIIESSP